MFYLLIFSFAAPILFVSTVQYNNATYSCSSGVIEILNADFYALLGPPPGVYCGALVTNAIGAMCNGFATCTFEVNIVTTGKDTCVGPLKTLDTTYTCV